MSRRRRFAKREILPDPKYNSELLTKFANKMMKDGKKSLSEQIIYSSLDMVEERTGKGGLDVFEKAIENARPLLEVKSRRVGGATYQVPVEVPMDRGVALAMRWLIKNARARSEKTMAERLAGELMASYNKEGATIRKREDTHKMAEANKAFAHFRW